MLLLQITAAGGGGGSDFRGVFRWRLARTISLCSLPFYSVWRVPAYVCLSAAVISWSKRSGLHTSSACRLEEGRNLSKITPAEKKDARAHTHVHKATNEQNWATTRRLIALEPNAKFRKIWYHKYTYVEKALWYSSSVHNWYRQYRVQDSGHRNINVTALNTWFKQNLVHM